MQGYIKFIHNYYKAATVTVVFDGYEQVTTKCSEGKRRGKKGSSVVVHFDETMHLKVDQEISQ